MEVRKEVRGQVLQYRSETPAPTSLPGLKCSENRSSACVLLLTSAQEATGAGLRLDSDRALRK